MEILIVEDTEDSRILLVEQLGSLGYKTRSAINGTDALDQIESAIPDMIISDILMPEMDGFELCRHLKRDSRYKSIPFIFYSATYTDGKDIELALSLGADRFIVKPELIGNIEKSIQDVLEEHQQPGVVEQQKSDLELDSLYEKSLRSKLDKKVAELESRKRQMYAITDALPVLIAEVNADLTYRYINHAYEAWYLLPYTQIIGKHMDTLDSADNYQSLKPFIEAAQKGESVTFESELTFPDGIQRNILGRYIVKERAEEGFYVLLTDISEQKKGELERELLQKQLTHAQKMQSIGHLSGGLAHDFNNILGITIAQLELIKRRVKDNPDIEERVEQALSNTWRGAELVSRLMDFARKDSIGKQVVDVNESLSLFKTLIEKSLTSAIKLQLNLQDDLNRAELDPGELESAILNLSINALHAMPNGGELTIETYNEQTNRFQIGDPLTGPNDFIVIKVSDTGCGMSEEVQEHLFEPFFTTKDKGKGTGLGLSMVFGFVQRSGGYIEVESKPDHGSSFLIYLPGIYME